MSVKNILLKGVQPQILVGLETDGAVGDSQVWLSDVQISKGDVCLIEAESGMGKSSLCSFLYGNRSDYEGVIAFDGIDARSLSVSKWCELRTSSLSLLPQEMRLFPELTVFENIEIKNSLTDNKSQSEIINMLDRLELSHKLNVPVAHLSIGQQQRVAIVRALCQPYDFLILDEPVSHLDTRNNELVAQLVVDEAGSKGAAIIVTSVGNPLHLQYTRQLSL